MITVTPETENLLRGPHLRLGDVSPPSERGKPHFISSQPGLVGFLEAVRAAARAEFGQQRTPVRMRRGRLCIEPAITREAAINASAEAITRIKLAQDAARSATNWDDYENQDAIFHRAVAEASDNIMLLALFDQLNQVRRAVAWNMVVGGTDRPPQKHSSFDEHDAILASVEGQDPARAYEAMRDHLKSVASRLFEDV